MIITKDRQQREAEVMSNRAYMTARGITPDEKVMIIEQRYINGEFTIMEDYDKAVLEAAGIEMSDEEYRDLLK